MTGIGPRYCKLGRAVRYELRELERYKRANTIGGDAAEEM
jgi:hypothetical protein